MSSPRLRAVTSATSSEESDLAGSLSEPERPQSARLVRKDLHAVSMGSGYVADVSMSVSNNTASDDIGDDCSTGSIVEHEEEELMFSGDDVLSTDPEERAKHRWLSHMPTAVASAPPALPATTQASSAPAAPAKIRRRSEPDEVTSTLAKETIFVGSFSKMMKSLATEMIREQAVAFVSMRSQSTESVGERHNTSPNTSPHEVSPIATETRGNGSVRLNGLHSSAPLPSMAELLLEDSKPIEIPTVSNRMLSRSGQ